MGKIKLKKMEMLVSFNQLVFFLDFGKDNRGKNVFSGDTSFRSTSLSPVVCGGHREQWQARKTKQISLEGNKRFN